MSAGAEGFRQARDLLLDATLTPEDRRRRFQWPAPHPFNWALDWFDGTLAADPRTADRPALRIRDGATGQEEVRTFRDLSLRSTRIAAFLGELGLRRGDRVLVMLGNEPALWEVLLACFKSGLVVIPASTLLSATELADRLGRGTARAVVAGSVAADRLDRCAFGGLRIAPRGLAPDGWRSLDEAAATDEAFCPARASEPDDPLLLYFTSGTTALPKLVLHTHRSYPVGSLSTLHWLGLRPGDVHLNVSSPGWAKHAWSSFFVPWTAGATVAVLAQERFEPASLLRALAGMEVTSFCAPPTVWRHLASHGLGRRPPRLRELISSGEPLNAGIIHEVAQAWDLRVRDGYGQTETTALLGHPPGEAGLVGSMGRPLPGYDLVLLDGEGRLAEEEGEIALRLEPERPAGLTPGYLNERGHPAGTGGADYRTGDVARRNGDGTLTFVGRVDDVFKSSDYRIGPFELESVLVAHPAVREAAVVPMPDALRLSVPRAFVLLRDGEAPDAATAAGLFAHLTAHLSPYKRIRQIVFVSTLPKTLSGKIRRAWLREGGALEEELARFDEPEDARRR